jgi:inactivated superfamily I helicase
MVASGVDVADMLIFLPSRRAVRSVEKMIVEKSGGCAILPRLVALGEGIEEDDIDDCFYEDVISDTERVVLMAKLLAADACVGNLTTALPIAHDLVRMQNYLENEGIDASQINWADLVDENMQPIFKTRHGY